MKKQKKCECGNTKFLYIYSRARDNNYYKFPNGYEGEGYFPLLPRWLGDGDGCAFDLCIECGKIYGFDRDELKKCIERYEEEEEE